MAKYNKNNVFVKEITMDKIIRRTLDLVKIPSVSGNMTEIKKVLTKVKEEFVNKNVFIREFAYENASPVMLLSNHEDLDFDILTIGHLDVVPAEEKMFAPILENGCIYGRGSLDMKAQISVNLASLEYVLENYPALKFGALITTDEETTSNGIRALDKHEDIRAKIVFDNDAGTLFTVIEKYKHPVSVKITAEGTAAHSSRPWLGDNAVHNLMNCLQDMHKNFPYYAKDICSPDNNWVDTMVVTAFNSPATLNVVPASAEALINFRLTEKTSLEQLENILEKCCIDNRCRFEILLSSCGVYMDANHPIIQKYIQIAEEITQHKIEIDRMGGATDSRPFGKKSIVIMHGLNGEGEHSNHEYVEIDSILKLVEIQQRFIDDYASRS